MKKILLIVLIIFVACEVSARDMYSLEQNEIDKICGVWEFGEKFIPYEGILRQDFSWGFTDFPKYSDSIGYVKDKIIFHAGAGIPFEVYEIEKLELNQYRIKMFYTRDYQDIDGMKNDFYIEMKFINDDEFKIIDFNIKDFMPYLNLKDSYYRISGPSKDTMIHNGISNDSSVRIRKEPNLNGEVLGLLYIGDRVEVIKRTTRQMQIGEMLSPWYFIKDKNEVNGWVYGYFINID